jgi:class 3 adenylate cyclase
VSAAGPPGGRTTPAAARPLFRRPPFSVALVTLVVALTGLTGAVIGGLAWHEQRSRSRAIVDAAMVQAARLATAHTARFLRDAESTARLGPQLVEQRELDAADTAELERFTLAVLRTHPHLSWVSYGDRQDRFVGAWRDDHGRVFINRSFPADGRIRLVEDQVMADDRRLPARRSDDHGYRPRERPYFAAAERRRDVTWTEPYEFYAGGGLGITCAVPVLDGKGQVRGVFTVDFSLDRLGEFLDTIVVSPRSHVFIASSQGTVLLTQRRRGETRTVAEVDLASAIGRRMDGGSESAVEFEHQGVRYLGRVAPLVVGDQRWLVEVVVPEGDYTEEVDANARLTGALGLGALLLAAACGIAIAHWIARPLRELADDARQIRRGRLDVTVIPRSRDEIGVLARAMAEMVQGLRDRDFIRETLGRYVSPELAERCLRDREALHLGGELREVTVLMSDLRDFTPLSERLGPEATIGVLNRYLARMTPVILEHGGMIDEFIGDAILVVFGAPFVRADDTERAVRCAQRMQEAMPAVNEEARALGLPDLSMGIGVHCGTVVAGNIGSPDRIKYGVVGPPVNLVSRIQALTAGGEILVSDAVMAKTRDLVRVGPARQVRVKGAAEPVTIYPLLGLDGR